MGLVYLPTVTIKINQMYGVYQYKYIYMYTHLHLVYLYGKLVGKTKHIIHIYNHIYYI